MILSFGLLFGGCVLSSFFVVKMVVEDEAILDDVKKMNGCCGEVEDDE